MGDGADTAEIRHSCAGGDLSTRICEAFAQGASNASLGQPMCGSAVIDLSQFLIFLQFSSVRLTDGVHFSVAWFRSHHRDPFGEAVQRWVWKRLGII